MSAGTGDERAMPPAGSALILGSLVGGLLLSIALADSQGAILFAAYAGIGAFLAIRRPGNAIGWLLMLIGWGLAIGSMRVEAPIEALLAGQLDPRTVVRDVGQRVRLDHRVRRLLRHQHHLPERPDPGRAGGLAKPDRPRRGRRSDAADRLRADRRCHPGQHGRLGPRA